MQYSSGDEVPTEDGADSGHAPVLAYRRAAVNRKPRRPVSAGWWVAAAGIVLLLFLMGVGALLAPLFAYNWDAIGVAEIAANRPAIGFPARFQMVAQGIGRGSGMRMQYGYVLFQGEDRPGSMSFDLRTGRCTIDTYQGVRSEAMPLGREAVLMYVLRAGYAANDPAAGRVADALWREIDRMRTQPPGPQVAVKYVMGRTGVFEYAPTERRFLKFDMPSLRRSESYDLPWYTPWVLGIWVLVWGWVSRLIVRRRRTGWGAYEVAMKVYEGNGGLR